jgi:hypothetical protein
MAARKKTPRSSAKKATRKSATRKKTTGKVAKKATRKSTTRKKATRKVAKSKAAKAKKRTAGKISPQAGDVAYSDLRKVALARALARR